MSWPFLARRNLSKPFLAFLFFLYGWIYCCPLTGISLLSSQSAGMGGINCFQTSVWSVCSNQAGLAAMRGPQTGMHYENRYMLSQTAGKAAAVAFPAGKTYFGGCYSAFGYSLYSEGRTSLAAARRLAQKVSAGIGMNYHFVRAPTTGNREQLFTAEAGMIADAADHLKVSFHLANPWIQRSKLRAMPFVSPVLTAGVAYIERETMVALAFSSDVSGDHKLMAGISQQLSANCIVRAGAAPLSAEYGFGMGVLFGRIHCDVSFLSHLRLGFCPYLSLAYDLFAK